MSDKSKTPTGVFVRLPLSDNEKMALTSGVKMGGSIDRGMLAIGTPVAGGELEVIGFQLTEDGDSYGIFETEKEANSEGWQTFEEQTWSIRRVVLEAEAQAALSAAQAESARLRRALQEIHDTGHDLPEFMRVEMMVAEAEKALKGPEA